MSFVDDNPNPYVSTLSHFKGLPPLDLCLEEAFFLEKEFSAHDHHLAYSKAKDFFLGLSGSDINLQFDASYLLSQHTLKLRVLDADVMEILGRIVNQKTNSIIRNGDSDVYIRRRISKGEDYHLASSISCDCPYKQYVTNVNKICVHMAIIRVIEATFLRMIKNQVNEDTDEE